MTTSLNHSNIQNVVLVHGAFSDGSCYTEVIRQLHAHNINAIAVQNPLTSLTDDVNATRYILDKIQGDTLLVGHSYGGAVITQAGNHHNVKKLAYLSAIVPNTNESAVQALQRAGAKDGLQADEHGLVYLPDDVFHQVMVNDLTPAESRLLSSKQTPISLNALTENTTQTAWQNPNIQSHYLITERDNALPIDVQTVFANQITNSPKRIQASHLSMISQAKIVADWLLEIVQAA